MDKYSILAELLYIISNYEKGRIPIKRIWSRRYINSLQYSIGIMNNVVDLMKQNNTIEIIDIRPIFDYIEKNTGVVFPYGICEKIYSAYQIGILSQYSNDVVKCELFQLMENILLKCNTLLKGKQKNYKKKITYLLMALHNIPRALLGNDRESYLNIEVLPLNFNDAKKVAQHYIALSEKS